MLLSLFEIFNLVQTAAFMSTFQTSLASKSQTIGGEALLVTGIQREIESISDLPTTWHSHFDQFGCVPCLVVFVKFPTITLRELCSLYSITNGRKLFLLQVLI